MSWLYSRALAGEFLAGNCLDGKQYAPLKSIHTPQAYLSSDKMTAYSRLSRYGMMFAHLTDDHGAELLKSYLGDFHARISQAPERVQELPANDQDYGKNLPASLAKYDRDTALWKTRQFSLAGDSEPFSETWPRWGTMRNGECWERLTPERRTSANGYGYSLPTPTCNPEAPNKNSNSNGPKNLLEVARGQWSHIWPTPRARMGGNKTDTGKCRLEEVALAGGQLNPTWVEWLMGWPLGWTDLKPLEMDKYQQWLDSHGIH